MKAILLFLFIFTSFLASPITASPTVVPVCHVRDAWSRLSGSTLKAYCFFVVLLFLVSLVFALFLYKIRSISLASGSLVRRRKGPFQLLEDKMTPMPSTNRSHLISI